MTGAIILAAGFSSRMGSPKALLEIDGRTFLEMCLEALRACDVAEVRVVLGRDEEAIRTRVALEDDQVVVNPRPEDGMLSSVRCGVLALPTGLDDFFLWPVDHATVKPETLSVLLATRRASNAPIAVPVVAGRRGHPVLFASGLRSEILDADDAIGVRGVVRAHAENRIEIPVDDPGPIDDVDTPQEFQRLAARIR